MKVIIDKDLCTGCELCCASAPSVFSMDEDTSTAKINEGVDLDAASTQEEIQEAQNDCPASAIQIEL